MRTSLIALLVALVGSCASPHEGTTAPTTIAGTWHVEGQDASSWKAQLVLDEAPDRSVANSGHFDWKSDEGYSGHELVTWSYDPDTRMVVLVGQEMQDPVGLVGVGTYVAKVSEDGRSMENGTWGPPAMPGTWEARR